MSLNCEPFLNQSLESLAQKEQVFLPYFNSDVAWEIGTLARDLAKKYGFPNPIMIDITTADGATFFHSPSKPSTIQENEFWVARKRKTVLRFGCSSYYMGEKFRTMGASSVKDALFIDTFDYAIHGGSVPIRITGYTGVIAVLTISGLSEEEDHAFALELLNKVATTLKEI